MEPIDAAEATRLMQAAEYPCAVGASGRERGVFASRDIEAGTCIASERPFALTIAREACAYRCAHCLADSRMTDGSGPSAWPRRCAGCKTLCFCGERCEAAVRARGHDECECEALAAVAADASIEDDEMYEQVVQAVRILCDRAAGRTVDAGPAGVVGFASYAARLVGHPPGSDAARQALRASAAAALRALPERARVPPAELTRLLERHSCNLYGVTLHGVRGQPGSDTASASFVGFLHLFNHACNPNIVFDAASPLHGATDKGDPPCYGLYTLERVRPGQELRLAYLSGREGPGLRREHLREWYGFDCTCERCECDDPCEELAFAEALDALRCTADDGCC